MAKVIVSYDLNRGWGEVKDALFKGNFYNVLSTTSGNKVAPNTTVFINDVAPSEALRQFDIAVADAEKELGQPITVQKIIAARMFDDWRIRSDSSGS